MIPCSLRAPCDLLLTEVSEDISRVCVVRVESINQPNRNLAAQRRNSPPLPNGDDILEQLTVKQEKPEEESDDPACCLDSIKLEDFSPECMSAVQSNMLEEWKPEVLDIQSQDSDTLSCTGLTQGKKENNERLKHLQTCPCYSNRLHGDNYLDLFTVLFSVCTS